MRSAPVPSVVALLEAALAAHAERLRALAVRARAGGDDALVHDTRVSLRRIEALARLYRGAPGCVDADAARAAARGPRRRLSRLRSEEVGRALLASRLQSGDGDVAALAFPGELPATRVAAADLERVARALSAWRRRLRSELEGAFAPRAAAGERLLPAALRRVRRRLSSLLRLLPPRARTLHEARIAAKRARYALEAVEPLRPEVRALLRQLRAFQEAAGEAHDLVEVGLRLRDGASRGGPAAAAARRVADEVEGEAARAIESARLRGALLEGAARRVRATLRQAETR